MTSSATAYDFSPVSIFGISLLIVFKKHTFQNHLQGFKAVEHTDHVDEAMQDSI